MIKKLDKCLYCGEKMESKTAKKKFCCDTHRVYWNREQKNKKENNSFGIIPTLMKPENIKPYTHLKKEDINQFLKEEKMPEGLTWQEEIQWYRNHKK